MPISAAPVFKGAIAFQDSKIIAVNGLEEIAARFPAAQIKNFGTAAILPGLVNSHTHLELTAMRGFLDAVENDFPVWLVKLATARDQVMTREDIENSALCGAAEAARAGVTCVGDIGKHGFAGAKALRTIGLRGVSYQENSFAADENAAAERFAEICEKVAENREFASERVKIGITPHAPYTVSRKLFELLTDYALRENLPVTIHAAESLAEAELMREGTGGIAEMLRRFNIQWQSPRTSTIKYLRETGILQTKPLLAHCINVDAEDLQIIAATNTKIAHCPKSNAKFAHGIAPFKEMLDQNIGVGLGSDSVASNNLCDMLEEARFASLFQRLKGNFVSAETVLHAATLGGARALGMGNIIGSLEIGKQADFCVVSLDSLPQQPVFDAAAALVFASSARDIVQTTIAGETIYENGIIHTIDEQALRAKLLETSARIAG